MNSNKKKLLETEKKSIFQYLKMLTSENIINGDEAGGKKKSSERKLSCRQCHSE